MPERAWTLRSISSCQISSVNIVPGVKIQRRLFQQLYIQCYPCVGHRARDQEERWINEMNEHDRYPQMLMVYWGDSWSTVQSDWSLLPCPLGPAFWRPWYPGTGFLESQASQRSVGGTPTLGTQFSSANTENTENSGSLCFLAVFAVSFTIFAACHRSHYICLSI